MNDLLKDWKTVLLIFLFVVSHGLAFIVGACFYQRVPVAVWNKPPLQPTIERK